MPIQPSGLLATGPNFWLGYVNEAVGVGVVEAAGALSVRVVVAAVGGLLVVFTAVCLFLLGRG